MKIKLSKLRALIREAVREEGSTVFGTYAELNKIISAMDADTVATKDYIDDDTGEVYLETGEQARKSALHPQHVRTSKKRYSYYLTLQELIDQFVEEIDVESIVDPGEIPDIADGFFHVNPSWEAVADEEGQTRESIKTTITDLIHAKTRF